MSYPIISGNGDLLGQLLRRTGNFKGGGRLMAFWMRRQNDHTRRVRHLPGGGKLLCDLSIPYEAMVWLQKEEEADLHTLQSLLKPGQRFVDCGANIGLWSLAAASAVGNTGSVVAFEPNPATYDKLLGNIAFSEFTNITPQPYALSSAAGVVPFTCAREHNISQIADADEETSINARAITLDEALRQKGQKGAFALPVAGCKMDVEGHELQALQGAAELLRQQHPWLCIEFNTILTKTRCLGDWNVHRFLRDMGYAAYRFEDASAPSSANQLKADWQTDGYCNLYYI